MRQINLATLALLALAGCASQPPAASTQPAEPASAATATAAPRTVETPPKATEQSATVYRTKSGTKYHRGGCSYLRGGAIPISLNDARARGLGPCSRCSP